MPALSVGVLAAAILSVPSASKAAIYDRSMCEREVVAFCASNWEAAGYPHQSACFYDGYSAANCDSAGTLGDDNPVNPGHDTDRTPVPAYYETIRFCPKEMLLSTCLKFGHVGKDIDGEEQR